MNNGVNGWPSSLLNTNALVALSYVAIGSSPASSGALRLANTATISWRNAANTANKSITLDSSDGLSFPGVLTIGGSDGTAGQINFFSSAVGIGRTGNTGLKLFSGNGSTGLEILNNTKNLAVGIGASSDFTNGTVEKLRVINPTTVDNAANTILSASATTAKPLVVQGIASQSANLQEWQDSTGATVATMGPSGAFTTAAAGSITAGGGGQVSGGIGLFTSSIRGGGTIANAGAIRLANNVSLNWRNAANSADMGITLNSTNALVLAATSVELQGAGLTEVTVDANGLTMTDNRHIVFSGTTGTKIGTATTQKLSFWNATPVVQPTTGIASATFVANTSAIADNTATFDGYTIGQVVKALRTIGILA